jgi:PAS domain S-box-containing protein
MEDVDKSKEQLLEELSLLREELRDLEPVVAHFQDEATFDEDAPGQSISDERAVDSPSVEVPFLSTRTIDLTRILEEDVTESGSYDLRGIRGSSLGKLLDALTIPALLVAEKRSVWFCNRCWSRSIKPMDKTEGISFESLFPDADTSHRAVSNLTGTLRDRKSRVFDATLESEGGRLWSRVHTRSVRISSKRYILVLIEDRTLEVKQLLLNKKHRAELEKRVKERTAELRDLNLKLSSEILERKRIEANTLKDKETIEALLNATTDIAALIDANGVILAVNSRGAMAFGKKTNDLIGRPSAGFLAGSVSVKRKDMLKRVVETGLPVRFQDEEEERILDHSYYPVSGHGPDVGAVAVFTRDVTDQIRAGEALRASEEKYRLVVENAGELIFIIQQGIIEFANARALHLSGYSRDELASRDFLEFVHPADRTAVMEHQKHLLKPGATAPPYSCKMVDKEGNTWWAHISSVGINWKDRPANLVFGTDITQLKKSEEQVEKSLSEKEILLREIHHRVKNNLQLMSSLLRLQSHHLKEEDVLNMFKEAETRVRSMALFHEKLYQSESLAEVDSGEYINGLLSYLTQSYGHVGTRITVLDDVRDVTLGIDCAIPLGLIITELFSNCLKHGFPGEREGWVRISLKTRGQNEFELTVADNGVGLPEDVDLENPKTFGLDIVWTFVKQLQGVVEVNREQGTEFKVTFREAVVSGKV